MTPLLENPRAEHQIVLLRSGRHGITVSCTCRRVIRWGRQAHQPIASSPLLPAAEAIGEWRAWHRSQGVEL